MRRISLAVAIVLMPWFAQADSLSDSNLRNAGHLFAYKPICNGDGDRLARRYRDLAIKGGISRKTADRTIAKVSDSLVAKAKKDSEFMLGYCLETEKNLPKFSDALEGGNNDPSHNPVVVISQAEADCRAVVPARTNAERLALYDECVESQVQIWRMQQRYQ